MQVMLAKFRTERCAVKQIICETKAEYRAAMQEMLLMQELQFDKIVRFFGAIKRGRGVLWMCMEYMPFSDLRKVLHSGGHRRDCRFPESMLTLIRRLKWAKDVVAALDLLHSRAVVHRDLKPGNVLISNKGDAVLSDFGLSRVREAQQSRLQVCPSPRPHAPGCRPAAARGAPGVSTGASLCDALTRRLLVAPLPVCDRGAAVTGRVATTTRLATSRVQMCRSPLHNGDRAAVTRASPVLRVDLPPGACLGREAPAPLLWAGSPATLSWLCVVRLCNYGLGAGSFGGALHAG